MKIYVMDAFAAKLFGGNQAGVALPEGDVSDETMRLIAAELKHSETAFVRPRADGSVDLRYFTPAGEVELCGHATIAGFALLRRLGLLADRLSVNIELPSEESLGRLAPDKAKAAILAPMAQIRDGIQASRGELARFRHAPRFAPAGQSTQMIVGASPETDYHILKLTEGMYQKYSLKRVFYSAYIPVAEDTRLPALDTKPPLLREHRLYQADWLLRFYQFEADEILDQDNPNFNPYLDPKCNWAVQHYGLFPVDVNRAPFEMLLRVPGIGPKSARRIWRARKQAALGLDELKRMGVVLKRAQYFITCRGFAGAHPGRGSAGRECITRALIDPNVFSGSCEQLSLFSPPAVDNLIGQGVPPRAAVRMVREEAVQCLAKAL